MCCSVALVTRHHKSTAALAMFGTVQTRRRQTIDWASVEDHGPPIRAARCGPLVCAERRGRSARALREAREWRRSPRLLRRGSAGDRVSGRRPGRSVADAFTPQRGVEARPQAGGAAPPDRYRRLSPYLHPFALVEQPEPTTVEPRARPRVAASQGPRPQRAQAAGELQDRARVAPGFRAHRRHAASSPGGGRQRPALVRLYATHELAGLQRAQLAPAARDEL